MIRKDHMAHLKLGVPVALQALAVALLAVNVGLWAAVLAGAASINGGYEIVQKIRREGIASIGDAAFGTLPALLLSAVLAWAA
jgi:hypothetical protein